MYPSSIWRLSRLRGSTPRTRALTVALLVSLFACSPDQVSNPLAGTAPTSGVEGQSRSLPPLQAGDSAGVDSLTRAFALALADPALRVQVHDDLRDSPFSGHRIHLASYLKSSRGRALLAAMSVAAGSSSDRIAAAAAIRGGLEISIPSATDRMFWDAENAVVVEGTALTVPERRAAELRMTGVEDPSSAAAYTFEGAQLRNGLATARHYPMIYVSPSEQGFGVNPEARRAAAPRANRRNISSADEEMDIVRERGAVSVSAHAGSGGSRSGPAPSFMIVCPPDDPTNPCNTGSPLPPPPPRPMGVSIPSGRRFYDCYRPGYFSSLEDRDLDGVSDSCENELAIAFSPQLVLDAADCEVRRQPAFAVREKVSPDWGPVIQIFYAISYMYDCGPFGHRGDSEWIIEEVGPSNLSPPNGPWALKYATLSAHWGDPGWIDNTAGYAARDLEDAQGSPGFGPPRIWVSSGKHANYRTQSVCNGHWGGFQENCDSPIGPGCYPFLPCPNPTYFGLGIGFGSGGSSRPVPGYVINLGSHLVPFIGAAGNGVPDWITGSPLAEFYWIGAPFCGWVAANGQECAGSYTRSLTAYGY